MRAYQVGFGLGFGLVVSLLIPAWLPQQVPAIAATATQEQSVHGLAKHLQKTGATMYGAFWCPYCQRQEKSFGSAFKKYINYVECDPRGKNAQPQRCRTAGVRSFPTWVLKGRRHEGYLSLAELASLSGYNGPKNF